MRNIAIAGIHTDAGKTCVSTALCHAFNYEYFKLVQAGKETDETAVKSWSPKIITHAPGIMLQTPTSPHKAMILEGINYEGLKINIPKKYDILLETAGGLFTPMDAKNFMIDYIFAKKLPVFLVVRNYLGAINHAFLSVEALFARKIELLGVIFSGKSDILSENFIKNHYENLPFFHLKDFGEVGFENAANALKNDILAAGVKL